MVYVVGDVPHDVGGLHRRESQARRWRPADRARSGGRTVASVVYAAVITTADRIEAHATAPSKNHQRQATPIEELVHLRCCRAIAREAPEPVYPIC
jgi:hypothetical protein